MEMEEPPCPSVGACPDSQSPVQFVDVAHEAGLTCSERLGSSRSQALHHRGQGQRSRFFRLRPRRLARHLSDQRNATGREVACRPGAHFASVQEQSRRHVHRRRGKSWARAHRLADRRLRRRLRQRWLGRPLLLLLGTQHSFSQQRRRHLYGRHSQGRSLRRARPLGRRLHLARLRSRRAPRSFRLATTSGSIPRKRLG